MWPLNVSENMILTGKGMSLRSTYPEELNQDHAERGFFFLSFLLDLIKARAIDQSRRIQRRPSLLSFRGVRART